MARMRNAKGQFVSGGGGGGTEAGGVYALVELDTSQVDPAVAKVDQSLRQIEQSFTTTAQAANNGGRGVASFGASMLTAAAFVDDMQYGLRAVVNQIPMVAQAIGMGAGLAGAVSILAVGINIAVNNWERLTDAFTTRGPETASQEMERLAEKTGKSADEQARLNELKREEQQIEAQKNRRTVEEERAGAQVGEAIRGAPYGVLRKDVEGVLLQEAGASIEEAVQKRIQQIRARTGLDILGRELTPDAVENLRETERRRRMPALSQVAEQMISRAENGSGEELNQLREMARRNPNRRGLQLFNAGLPNLGMEASFQQEEEALRAQNEAEQERVRQLRLEQQGSRQSRLLQTEMEKKAREYQRGVAEGSDAEAAENDANFRDAMKRKMEQRIDFTPGEYEALPQDMKDDLLQRRQRDARSISGLNERQSDLNWRRFQLLNPERENQRMGLDQFESSVHGGKGIDEMVKLQHELNEIQKEHLKIAREKAKIGGVQRR